MEAIILVAALIVAVVVYLWRRSKGEIPGRTPRPPSSQTSAAGADGEGSEVIEEDEFEEDELPPDAVSSFAEGQDGVRFMPPEGWTLLETQPNGATWQEENTDLHWSFRLEAFRTSVREDELPALEGEIRAHAIAMFQSAQDEGAQRPEFSPLVSVEMIHLGSAPAITALRRLAYEPGREVVAGHLIVPIETGLLEVTVAAQGTDPGVRERFVVRKSLEALEAEDEAELPEPVSQLAIDDPEFDGKEGCALTAVRRGLERLVAMHPGTLEITAPAPETKPGQRVWLDNAECSIVPPARYVPIANTSRDQRLSKSIDVLSRVGLGAECVRLLDVYRLPGVFLDPTEAEELEQHAVEDAKSWKEQGVSDLNCELHRMTTEHGHARLTNVLVFEHRGKPTRMLAHWLILDDRSVYRVGIGGPGYIHPDELHAEIVAVAASLDRTPLQ